MLATEKLKPEERAVELGNKCPVKEERVESGQEQRTGSVGNSAVFTTEPYRSRHHKA